MAGRKLLLADDSITIQKVVSLTFADEGIDVVAVGDGDLAVLRILDELPDVVIADVNMPGLNGYQVCERIRSDPRTNHIPVILLIGAFEQFDEKESARVGASAHLTKPFPSIRQLVNQVTDLIEAGRNKMAADDPIEGDAERSENEPGMSLDATNPFDDPIRSQFDSFREDRIASIDHHGEELPEPLPASGDHGVRTSQTEADDIDRLYRQSVAQEPLSENEEFPDLGVDDEMIETSYSSSQPGSVGLEIDQNYGSAEAVETVDESSPRSELLSETQPLSQDETVRPSAANLPDETDASEMRRPGETIRLDPAVVDAQMAEANRRFDPIEQPPAPTGESTSPIGEDTIRMESRFDTKGSGSFEFDEADLLDIPSETPVEITTPADAAAKGRSKQIVTLSPDLIEMIAQRVVEKLSEKY